MRYADGLGEWRARKEALAALDAELGPDPEEPLMQVEIEPPETIDLEEQVPSTNGSAPVRPCALEGCDQPVLSKRARYCCRDHQRRAMHLRERGKVARIGPPVPIRQGIPREPESPMLDVAGLVSLAGRLPAGWRIELTPDSACFTWAS
jgi:hypothetical protein